MCINFHLITKFIAIFVLYRFIVFISIIYHSFRAILRYPYKNLLFSVKSFKNIIMPRERFFCCCQAKFETLPPPQQKNPQKKDPPIDPSIWTARERTAPPPIHHIPPFHHNNKLEASKLATLLLQQHVSSRNKPCSGTADIRARCEWPTCPGHCRKTPRPAGAPS